MKGGSAQHIFYGLILGCRFNGCTFYFTVNILQFLAKDIKIIYQMFFEYRVRSKKKKENDNNKKNTSSSTIPATSLQ